MQNAWPRSTKRTETQRGGIGDVGGGSQEFLSSRYWGCCYESHGEYDRRLISKVFQSPDPQRDETIPVQGR